MSLCCRWQTDSTNIKPNSRSRSLKKQIILLQVLPLVHTILVNGPICTMQFALSKIKDNMRQNYTGWCCITF